MYFIATSNETPDGKKYFSYVVRTRLNNLPDYSRTQSCACGYYNYSRAVTVVGALDRMTNQEHFVMDQGFGDTADIIKRAKTL